MRGARNHQYLFNSQRIGIIGDLRQSAPRDHAGVVAGITGDAPIEWRAGRRDQLYQLNVGHGAQHLQIAGFK